MLPATMRDKYLNLLTRIWPTSHVWRKRTGHRQTAFPSMQDTRKYAKDLRLTAGRWRNAQSPLSSLSLANAVAAPQHQVSSIGAFQIQLFQAHRKGERGTWYIQNKLLSFDSVSQGGFGLSVRSLRLAPLHSVASTAYRRPRDSIFDMHPSRAHLNTLTASHKPSHRFSTHFVRQTDLMTQQLVTAFLWSNTLSLALTATAPSIA